MTSTIFASTYGKNANDKNAFGKCVSKVNHSQTQNEISAGATCKAAQASNTLAATYGTDANAFGKCVSSKANAASQAQQQATVAAAKTCAGLLKADAVAFKKSYSTFGRCVSQHTH